MVFQQHFQKKAYAKTTIEFYPIIFHDFKAA